MDQKSHEIPLNQLPNEIILKLFQYLGFKDQMTCCLVCKRWCELLYLPQFKRSLILDKFCHYELEGFCQRSFNEIIITEDFLNVGRMKRNQFFSLMGEKTEIVTFTDGARNLLGQDLLMNLPRLRQINFYNSDQLKYFQIPSTVHKIDLKYFDLDITKNNFQKLQEKLQNVAEVNLEWIELTFEGSEELNFIELPGYFKNFGVYGKFRVKQMNLKNLEKITCDDVTDIADDGLKEFFEPLMALELTRFTNLKSYSLTVQREQYCFFFHQTLGFTLQSIETISINDFDMRRPYRSVCNFCIINLIKVCPNIKSWRIRGNMDIQEKLIDFTKKPIRALDIDSDLQVTTLNYPEIEVLRLDAFDIDWSNVSPMPKLKKLFLGNDKMTLEQLKILVQKCPSIEHFSYLGGCKKGFIEVMKANWPALKKIYVHYRKTGQPGYFLKGLNSFALSEDFVTDSAPNYDYGCSYQTDLFFHEFCKLNL